MKHNTIEAQDVWSQLFEIIRSHVVSKTVFESLISFIDPPSKYNSFATTARNLVHILTTVQDILSASRFADKKLFKTIQEWHGCCEVITASLNVIESCLPGFCASGSNHYSPPFRNHFESHSLAVALWCSVQDEDLHRRYVIMQAHLFMSYHALQTQSVKKQKLTSSAKVHACLAARKLAQPKFIESLKIFPDRPLPMQAYRKAIELFDKDKDFGSLSILFDYALETKTVREVRGQSLKRRTSGAFSDEHQVVSFSGDDESDSGESLSLYKVQTGSKNEIADRKSELCFPGEFSSSREFAVLEHEGEDPSGGLSDRQQRMMARGISSAITMNNQRFPGDWDRLTAFELANFLKALNVLAIDSTVIAGIPSQELAAFLSICFWMSAPIEVAQGTTVVPQAARCEDVIGIQWSDSDNSGLWVVRPRVAEQQIVDPKKLQLQALEHADRYTLYIPNHAAASMNGHLTRFHARIHPIKIFTHTINNYEKAAGEFLSNLRRKDGGRYSLQRISMHMHYHIAQLPGSDITAAMSITGRSDTLGAVPLHYTANSIERLREIYATACNTSIADAGLTSELSQTQAVSVSHVGSRYVPKPETVKNLFDRLRKEIETTRKISGTDPIPLHNAITVYTVTMLGFATGYRAVRDPLLQEAEIDRESGFAVISDKDDDTFYNSRIIWLPGICLQQLDLYKSHISELQHWLFSHNLQLFFDSREMTVTGRQACRENPALFLLDEKGEDLPVQPKHLKEHLAKTAYNLPINSNRHYLRTYLMERRCPLEIVSAFLGHWERGLEPWGRYSGLSPLVYREELSKHIFTLIDEFRWKPEAGLKAVIGNRHG